MLNDIALFASLYPTAKMVPEHKIKSVEALHVGQFLFVKIVTDHGVVGWGEGGV